MGLPEEIMEEILLRVEGRALLKFRCVSKSWRCLIDNERFRKAQLENSRKNTCFLGHVVIVNTFRSLVHLCRVQWLLNEACLDPMNEPWLKRADIVGSFNGLICLVERDRDFIMWNPSTRIFKRLPLLDSSWRALARFGMGWFESSGEYKIFAVVDTMFSGDTYFEDRVYSSKTNSWKTIRLHESNFRCREKRGLFLSGKLHWVMVREYGRDDDEVVVVSLDLESEVYGLIELPFKRRKHECYLLLGELGGCLCAILDRRYESFDYISRRADVWVMKEYGVKESWQKLEPPFPASAPFVERENGEVVVFFGSAILVYYPKENVFHHRYIDKSPYPLRMLLCMDTLVSPDIASLI